MKRALVVLAALSATLGCAGSKPAAERPETTPPPAQSQEATPVQPTPPPLPEASTQPKKFGGQVVATPSQGLPLVVFRIAFQAGSIDDPRGQEGLTALTAALMAQGGTRELTSAQLLEQLFPMAAGIAVQVDKELTVFSGTVHRDQVSRYLPLLVAAITRPRWDPGEFKRLRDDAVVDIEKRLRTGDDEDLGKQALAALMWAGHPYAHYVGGTVQGLRGVTLDDARAQWGRVFTQDRMLIGVGGAVSDELVAQLKQGLGALNPTGAELVALPQPSRAGPKVLLVEKGADSTAVSMGYPYALERGDPDFYPMMVAVSALGEHRQFIGRLMKALRVERGLNYGDYAYVEHFEQEGWSTLPGLNVARRQQDFTVWLRPVATENELFAIRAARFQLGNYRAGITQEEFETARGFLSGYTLLWEQTPMRRLGYAIDDVFYGTRGHLQGFRNALATMTVGDVNRVIAKWIDPGALKTAVVTRDAASLRQRMIENTPSPVKYAAQTPDPGVLEEDRKIIGMPLGVGAADVVIKPAAELFER